MFYQYINLPFFVFTPVLREFTNFIAITVYIEKLIAFIIVQIEYTYYLHVTLILIIDCKLIGVFWLDDRR